MRQVILTLCILTMMVIMSSTYLYGIQKPIFIRELNTNIVLTSYVSTFANLLNLITMFAAPQIMDSWGFRWGTLIAILFQVSGNILSSLAPNVWILMITWPLMQVAQGLSQMQVSIILPVYFKENLHIYNSLVNSAQGLGIVIFSQLMTYLIVNFDYKVCLQVQLVMVVTVLIFNLLYFSPEQANQAVGDATEHGGEHGGVVVDGNEDDAKDDGLDRIVRAISTKSWVTEQDAEAMQPHALPKVKRPAGKNRWQRHWHFHKHNQHGPTHCHGHGQLALDQSFQEKDEDPEKKLIDDGHYTFLGLMGSKHSIWLANLGIISHAFNYKTIFEFVVLFQEHEGFTFEQASFLVTVMAITNFFMRLFSAAVVQAIGVFNLQVCVGLFMGTSLILMPVFGAIYWVACILCVTVSIGVAWFTSQLVQLTFKLQPESFYKFAIGQTMTDLNIGILTGVFIVGQCVEQIGFEQTFQMQGCISYLGSFFFCLAIQFNRIEMEEEERIKKERENIVV